MSNKKLNERTNGQLRSLASKIANHEGAMTAEQVAKILCVSKLTLERRARRGTIPSFRIGSLVRFDPANIAAFLIQMRNKKMSGNKF